MPRPTGRIKVAVVGAAGKMGSEVCRTLSQAQGIDLVAAVDTSYIGENLQDVLGPKVTNLTISDKLGAELDGQEVNVVVDFTHPGAAADHALSAIKRNVAVVIGTSGISNEDIKEISIQCTENKTPVMLVPNFAIGAVLMMMFSEMAARWMPDVEIIEMHHDQKADAPSGTAKRTAEMIVGARRTHPSKRPTEIIRLEGVRGGNFKDVHIHSVRLKGHVAHQAVIFGGQGESLTIRHDSNDRSSFMGGVELCVREVWNQEGLVVGMERLLK